MAKREKSDENVGYELNTDSVSAGKGRPTPTRKEREAANLRPLVSDDRAAALQLQPNITGHVLLGVVDEGIE